MTPKLRFLTAGQAALQLGISAKALRLYEAHGLIAPGRTGSGWRCYGATDMERAVEIVRLRRLGLGLAAIGDILEADPQAREVLLATHRLRLADERRRLDVSLRAIERSRLGPVHPLAVASPADKSVLSFELPWPWAGEPFVLASVPPLTFITGPLGSGKTRFAMRLAQALPNGTFLGLDRLADGKSTAASPRNDTDIRACCQEICRQLAADGAKPSQALTILVEAILAGSGPLVIDMVEQDLDHATQQALIARLRRNPPERSLFLMTRSSAILDLSTAESGEAIIYCPANHSPPMIVRADPSCPGYEAVATCLASPDVRARSAGVIATFAAGYRAPNDDSRETIC